MLSIDTVIVADAWLEFNGCVVGRMVLRLVGEKVFQGVESLID